MLKNLSKILALLILALPLFMPVKAVAVYCKHFSQGINENVCIRNCQAAGCEVVSSHKGSWCQNWCKDYFDHVKSHCDINFKRYTTHERCYHSCTTSDCDSEWCKARCFEHMKKLQKEKRYKDCMIRIHNPDICIKVCGVFHNCDE